MIVNTSEYGHESIAEIESFLVDTLRLVLENQRRTDLLLLLRWYK